ncbi:hypothetical protein CHUAL_013224 [Chamberlinius hualienensis]
MADVTVMNETKKDGVMENISIQQEPAKQPQPNKPHDNLQRNQGNRPGGPRQWYAGRGGDPNKRGNFRHGDRMVPYGRHGGGKRDGDRFENQFSDVSTYSMSTSNLHMKNVGAEPKKFTSRNRLFVGNFPTDMTEEEFCKMFEPFGTFSTPFINVEKGFAFIKMDTRENAENARVKLNGTSLKGREIRIRFADKMTSVRVKNLSPFVSDELLESAFRTFGEVERAVVIVDNRGRPVGEGIVVFANKPAVNAAVERCVRGNFMLTASSKPVIVEPLDQIDDESGYPDQEILKSSEFLKERSVKPRFAQYDSVDFKICEKWKELFERAKQKRAEVENELALDIKHLEQEMEMEVLREELRQREQAVNNLRRQQELRQHEGDRMDDGYRHNDMMQRPSQENFMGNNRDLRIQQGNNGFMQQGEPFRQFQGGGEGGPGRGAGGPPGPINLMNEGNIGGPDSFFNNAGMPMPGPNQQLTGPPANLNNQGNSGPVGHMGRGGGGNMMGNMGMPMGMGGGPMGGGFGGMGNRRDGMDQRRNHRNNFTDPKRRRH